MRKLLIALSLLCACRDTTASDDLMSFSGTITSVSSAQPIGGATSILVKESDADPCGITFNVSSETEIVMRDGLPLPPSGPFLAGAKVRVWAEGVFESCPGQSSAERVEFFR